MSEVLLLNLERIQSLIKIYLGALLIITNKEEIRKTLLNTLDTEGIK